MEMYFGGAIACLKLYFWFVLFPGKVAIQKEDLQKYHNRDTWFQLQHVDADSEVQVRLSWQRSIYNRAMAALWVPWL